MTAITYTKNDHNIDQSSIDKDALRAIEKLQQAGFTTYLVGGSIRDLLLGHTPKDFDISTSATPDEIKKLFRNCLLIGRRFRLAHLRYGKKIIETATFRSGDVDSDELIIRDNQWGTPEQDALRRDFTINGLYYDPLEETVIDYVGGFDDIRKKLLRTIGEPVMRFKQDPVRMIRLIKFIARFSLDVEETTKDALFQAKTEIVKSSQARILEELFRMLESKASCAFFEQLMHFGMLEPLCPELATYIQNDPNESISSYLREMDTIQEQQPGIRLDRALLLCCLTYPVLDASLKEKISKGDQTIHMSDIQQEASYVLESLFAPFFQIPRRIKVTAVSIMTTQYRMTPLIPKKRKPRIPKGSYFIEALKFFNLRTRLQPSLIPTWEVWKEAFQNAPISQQKPTRTRRRRYGK